MTTSPASPSDGASNAFPLLHAGVQRWIWTRQWNGLRDIQERSIPVILAGDRDVVISAATAGGKTEAAFLPVVSAVAEATEGGFSALYLSPLKALINDQGRRLEDLCEAVEMPLYRWHGDVGQAEKKRARTKPKGLLLITPESLEALFVLRGAEVRRMFAGLRYVVVDELHAFLGTERGMQLQSLLHRLETVLERRVVRIGLSATLGDMRKAAAALRHDDADVVEILISRSDGQELRLQVRGYAQDAPQPKTIPGSDETAADQQPEDPQELVRKAIAAHLFKRLRGTHNLIFAGARRTVELYADALRGLSEDMVLPNEFFPHHGNLAKDLRETLEDRLREGSLPTTAVCTTTLELGIDIGDVESVAQIGPPLSIAAMRQRLGRSGRRPGKPAILRLYVPEDALGADSPPADRLRLDTAQAVAGVRLLVEGWCEPPPDKALHLSTLVHQILSSIAQRGGAAAPWLFETLCARGPFGAIDQGTFAAILRSMGGDEARLIEQAEDGMLLLGEQGERLVGHYSFYAVFESPEEYRVVTRGKTLGTLPVDFPVAPEIMIVFAGRRWIIEAVHDRDKVLEVSPAKGGVVPNFGGEGGRLHDRLAQETRAVLEDTDTPGFLNDTAQDHLRQGRDAYRSLGLHRTGILAAGKTTHLLPWAGGGRLHTLSLALLAEGLKTMPGDLILTVNAPADIVTKALRTIANSPPPAPLALAHRIANKRRQKFDDYLTDDLLALGLAVGTIDADSLPATAAGLLGR